MLRHVDHDLSERLCTVDDVGDFLLREDGSRLLDRQHAAVFARDVREHGEAGTPAARQHAQVFEKLGWRVGCDSL